MRSLLAQLRAFWRGLRRPSEVDADMNDEMRFHIEMEAQRLQRRGLATDEASRQAAVAFGGVEKYRGAGRDAFGFTWMRGMSVDLKLGLRMLAKFPGLTAVALFVSLLTVLSMARLWDEAFWKPAPVASSASALHSRLALPILAPIVFLVGLTLALTVFAGPVSTLTMRAAGQLLDRNTYIRAILGEEVPRAAR